MSSNSAPSRTNVHSDVTARVGVSIADMTIKLKQLKDKCIKAQSEIIDYINQIEDSRLRQIVFLRCIKLYSWDKVAENIGGGNTAVTCRKTFSRAFN